MKLSESQLFTIESLNRIEGFEWPDGGLLASASKKTKHVVFWAAGNVPLRLAENGTEFDTELCRRYKQKYWNDSLITRAEFESVDGWVRNDGVKPNIADDCKADLTLRDGNSWANVIVKDLNWALDNNHDDIMKWRCSKMRAGVAGVAPTHNIESIISQHKAARISTLEARRQLERAEAAEHSLLLSIEEWAESNGLDIRLLDESEENPELVITDWRDLRVGDVVWWEGNERWNGGEYIVGDVESKDYDGSLIFSLLISKYRGDWVKDHQQWKFIRRPAK